MTSNHPDSQVHPHATGPAAEMVKQHSEPQSLKLYPGWFCPFVQRVLLVLLEKQIPFQYIEVNPYHKPASLLSLNPRGLVPTLEYDSKPLYESTVICEFLEQAYPFSPLKLHPKDAYQTAYGRIWSDFVTSRIIPSFHKALQYQVTEERNSKEGLRGVKAEFLGRLKGFTEAMNQEGPFFFGKEISMTDLIFAPWAIRLWVFDVFKGGLEFGDEKWTKRWNVWLEAIEERESVRSTLSERAHYMPIYKRYADDVAQSELAKATRKGGGVP